MKPHHDDPRVLDLGALNETRELIGDARLESALSLFSTQLGNVLMVPDGPSAKTDILSLAHKLAPAASSLGFNELHDASRALLDTRDLPNQDAAVSNAWRDMRSSAARACEALKRVRKTSSFQHSKDSV